MRPSDDEIAKALDRLHEMIAARVRAEQLRDQLTGLHNLAGLNEEIRRRLNESPTKPFWLAFVEVDRFKSINDEFTYENADVLLKRIAETLVSALPYFGEGASAYRAHGDEFYLLGGVPKGAPKTTARAIAASLDMVRSDVSAIRITVEGGGVMQCTVSIGWLCSTDLPVTTERRIVSGVERAVAEAKNRRNCIVRYKASFERRHDTISLRADCRKCSAKFSIDLKRDANRSNTKLTCPNCRELVERPPAPPRPAKPKAAETI
jgi:diguanylate cyclase (GGDEF)-like protein